MLTDPVFVAVMLLLVIPGTYIVDFIVHDLAAGWIAVLGSSCIVIGALLLELPGLNCCGWGHQKQVQSAAVVKDSDHDEECQEGNQGLKWKGFENTSRDFTFSRTY